MFKIVRPPFLLRKYYHNFTWNIPGEGKKVYLTFDDGPIPGPTEFVLDTLNNFHVKATFFCIGNNVQQHPGIFERIRKEGHRVGNHTFHHKNGWLFNTEEYIQDVEAAAGIFSSDLFRPPYGRIKKSQAEILLKQYKVIMWDVLSYDYESKVTPAQCLKNVIDGTRPGSIIVFHDSLKAFHNVKEVLPSYLDYLLRNDFVPEILP